MPKLAITITPPPREGNKRLRNPNTHLYTEDKETIINIMEYNKIRTYIIYPEFSEKGRLHYHGILNLDTNQYIRFHKHAIHKLRNIGFVDITIIKELVNNMRYITYMSKEWGTTKEILDIENPIMAPERKKKVKSAVRKVGRRYLDEGITNVTLYDYMEC